MKRRRVAGPPVSAFAARRQAAELLIAQQEVEAKNDNDDQTVLEDSGGLSQSELGSEDQAGNQSDVLQSNDVHRSRAANIPKAEAALPAKIFKTENDTILGLTYNEAVSVQGTCTMTVLSGGVAVQGLQLFRNDSVHLASPGLGSNVMIQAITSDEHTTTEFGPDVDVVATVRFVVDAADRSLADAFEQYPVTRSCILAEPRFSRPDASTIVLPSDWHRAADSIDSGCHIVVGAKGTGKSTFLRFTLNRLSQSGQDDLHYLDLDPGQPEFSAPGQISLTLHKSGSLGPSCFAALPTVIRSHWIGETSPKEDPDHYMACIYDLIQTSKSHETGSSVVLVNTPGWIKGTGIELLQSIVNQLSAVFDTVVYKLGQVDPLPGHPLTVASQRSVSAPSAADLRTINLLSYFHRCGSQWQKSITASSYEIPLSTLSVFVMREEIPASEVSYAINGTIVALLSIESAYLQNFTHEVDKDIRMLNTMELSPEFSECLGLAIVHGIDVLRRTIHLITPVDLNIPDGFEFVLGTGSIELPGQLLLQNITSEPLPYVTDRPGEGIGWQSWHVRRNIGRRIRK